MTPRLSVRTGVGRALLRAAEDLARSRAAVGMHLTVGPENEGARCFYRAEGYKDFAVAMKKSLEANPRPPRSRS